MARFNFRWALAFLVSFHLALTASLFTLSLEEDQLSLTPISCKACSCGNIPKVHSYSLACYPGSSSLDTHFTVSSSLLPRLPPAFTPATRRSLLVSTRLSCTPFLVESLTTCGRHLSSMLSRNLLDCVVLCCDVSPAVVRVVKVSHKNQPVTLRLLPAVCRRPHLLPCPDQVACRKHLSIFSSSG